MVRKNIMEHATLLMSIGTSALTTLAMQKGIGTSGTVTLVDRGGGISQTQLRKYINVNEFEFGGSGSVADLKRLGNS